MADNESKPRISMILPLPVSLLLIVFLFLPWLTLSCDAGEPPNESARQGKRSQDNDDQAPEPIRPVKEYTEPRQPPCRQWPGPFVESAKRLIFCHHSHTTWDSYSRPMPGVQ